MVKVESNILHARKRRKANCNGYILSWNCLGLVWFGLVWFDLIWFGLFVHPFSHICNIGQVGYRLQFTTQLTIYGQPHNTI